MAFDGSRLVLDRARRIAGRGAYVHTQPRCVTVPGLARSLRRAVTPQDVQRLVAAMQMSSINDNSDPPDPADDPSENPDDLSTGLAGAKTVETPPRKAKEYRSEDARV